MHLTFLFKQNITGKISSFISSDVPIRFVEDIRIIRNKIWSNIYILIIHIS